MIYSFSGSLALNVFIVLFHNRLHFLDDYSDGPQKFHTKPTPRVGGFAIYIVAVAVSIYLYFVYRQNFFSRLSVAAFPIFFGGFIDDITNKVAPQIRLALSMISAVLTIWLLGGYLHRLDLPFVDVLMKNRWIAYGITVIAVTGLSNAFNIIDGYNGLVSAVSIMAYLAIGYATYEVHDNTILTASLVMAGFFVLNYPFGMIFLGDGGAYLRFYNSCTLNYACQQASSGFSFRL